MNKVELVQTLSCRRRFSKKYGLGVSFTEISEETANVLILIVVEYGLGVFQ